MFLFHKKADLQQYLQSVLESKTTIGFVPTMGALHRGHLSLLEKSVKNNTVTVISIFINPTQFNNLEDLSKYPRTLEADVEKIATVSDKIIVYAPNVLDIYAEETVAEPFNFDGLENQMEGKFRTGHFDGVGTVVKRLFEIVQPTNAYFGEKDFQQLLIIKKMVAKQKLNVNITGCAVFREENGLAMSSRNERLTQKERQEAAVIYEILKQVRIDFEKKSVSEITKMVQKKLKNHLVFELEYFEIMDEVTLNPCIRKNKNKKYRSFIAVFVNKIRLIDTISLN